MTSPTEHGASIEVSIVLPCLNEVDTLASCIGKAQTALRDAAISGEIIVADNGSSDGSRELALQLGVRVIDVAAPGYGNALMGGIAGARGRYIVMGDADDSYDFSVISLFVAKLRQGYDLVQGCRLPAGGGSIVPGAMPFLHRNLGNPALTFLARAWFRTPVNDVYCGMRAFSRQLYDRLGLRCTGMEFALEMIVKSSLLGARTAEVPITLMPDARRSHPPHLRTFRDGWRSLRFLIMYAPRWLYVVPGLTGLVFGAVLYVLVLTHSQLGRANLDAHTLLIASLSLTCGYQAILFAVLAQTFAVASHLMPETPVSRRWSRAWSVERGLVIALLATAAGLALIVIATMQWRAVDFGDLDYSQTMRLVVPGATLTALGFQTFLASLFVGTMRLSLR